METIDKLANELDKHSELDLEFELEDEILVQQNEIEIYLAA